MKVKITGYVNGFARVQLPNGFERYAPPSLVENIAVGEDIDEAELFMTPEFPVAANRPGATAHGVVLPTEAQISAWLEVNGKVAVDRDDPRLASKRPAAKKGSPKATV